MTQPGLSSLLAQAASLRSRIIAAFAVAAFVASFVAAEAQSAEMPPVEGRTNLAAGREVLFSPLPNYSLTARGGSDAADLTDGKTTSRKDRRIWFESDAVGWSYGGRVNLAIDLGERCAVDEIAIRLLGGSPQAGINFPVWIEAFTSDDGEHWRRVADCSRWRQDDFRRYGVPDDAGEAWIHCLRFTSLDAHGRWVGLRMYGGGLSCADELYVFGSSAVASDASDSTRGEPSDFTVSHPQPYFHKPELIVTTNLAAPLPIGLVMPAQLAQDKPLQVVLDVPAGVELLDGSLGGVEVNKAETDARPDGGHRYRFRLSPTRSATQYGRLYVRASGWTDGQTGRLKYRFAHAAWQSPTMSVPLHAVEVPKAPRLKRIMAGLGWWNAAETARWPDALDAWEQLGLNSFPLFAHWMKDGDPNWKLVEEARRRGFFIVNIDSPLHRMLSRRKKEREIYDQLEEDATSERLCISYRGRFYHEEIERFGKAMARARPDFTSVDIELWSWRGPLDSRKCTRCRQDYERSGLGDWNAWQLAKGDEIWRDLVTAARQEVKKASGAPFEIGGYDFRPGPAYQYVWSVDRNFPDWMQSSQVSTYSCLYPYHWQLVGDRVRQDRIALGRNDVLPWLSPGDAGTFPAEALQWTLLECYVNGARGVYFWSSRVWDAENLVAYNRVVRAIAPVEPIILKGDLVGDAASVEKPGRLSGRRRENAMVLLVADYFGRNDGELKLHLRVPARSEIRDLLTGRVWLNEVNPGDHELLVPLNGNRARLLHVHPLD